MALKIVRSLAQWRGTSQILKASPAGNKMSGWMYSSSTDNAAAAPVTEHATVQELTKRISARMGVEAGYNPIRESREELIQYLAKDQKDLPQRSMRDSFLEAFIPLASDTKLQDKYTTFAGYVRVGRLLEDMDIFAVMVAQKYILNPNLPQNQPSPQTLVTALADRIDFTDFVPKPIHDIRMSGHISWVGRSSMEVTVWLEQIMHGTWNKITRALFIIAARDPTNSKAAVVNPLCPSDDREVAIAAEGEKRKQLRQTSDILHVNKMLPSEQEQRIIHDMYLKTKLKQDVSVLSTTLPANSVWMSDCTISNTIFSQPENRNLHNTVFGGFIMRQATELSWVLGFKFSKYRPKLKSISDINFSKPIAVNSLIHMHAFVVFTQMQFIQISVYVEVFNPQTGKSDTTNTVHFTYEVPEIVQEVYPRTYQESMMYIDGRRHFFHVMKEGADCGLQLNSEGISHKSKL